MCGIQIKEARIQKNVPSSQFVLASHNGICEVVLQSPVFLMLVGMQAGMELGRGEVPWPELG